MCASAPLSSALVGRDHELSILRERLAAAIGGHGSLVLIGGEAGIGKTALAETLCHEATARGALMLAGRCYDLSETPPYGPWADLFGRYQQGDGPPLPDGFARPGAVGVVTSQGALFQAVQDFFATLAVSHTGGVLPLLLLAAYRADELPPAHPLARLLSAIVRESPVTRLDLRPLRADDVETITGAIDLANGTAVDTFSGVLSEAGGHDIRRLGDG